MKNKLITIIALVLLIHQGYAQIEKTTNHIGVS